MRKCLYNMIDRKQKTGIESNFPFATYRWKTSKKGTKTLILFDN